MNHSLRRCAGLVRFVGVLALAACGGTGNESDSGPNKTYLRVEAADADGEALQYQWRVTAGRIENRNAPETVWTLPDGPGLHFAYVVVSDGKGGYAEQQLAVASDPLGSAAPPRPSVTNVVQRFTGTDSGTTRRTFRIQGLEFSAAGQTKERTIYLPDVRFEIGAGADKTVVTTDLGGDAVYPSTTSTAVACFSPSGVALTNCSGVVGSAAIPASQNLRLYGHVALGDGGVCGTEDPYFGVQSSATVQLTQPDGSALGPAVRVNRFGDYALDAAVLVNADLRLRIVCESYIALVTVPTDPNGYASSRPIRLTHTIPSSRPRIVKVVANGPEGNVRGRMVVPEAGVASNDLPGRNRFLTFKGTDTRLSACKYYESFGAVGGCDEQGGMINPISLEDWKKQHKFSPYRGDNPEISATYINKMDLNLVRRMVGTKSVDANGNPTDIAFYVCNNPGPETRDQREVDEVIRVGLADEKRVACVAMEWSTTAGVKLDNTNVEQRFTKFLTFGPDGSLILSVNLDGRGEKFMPGACVACHAGTQYNGGFHARGKASPDLGAKFLPFDTGNFLFASGAGLTEAAQAGAIYELNKLVAGTEGPGANTPLTRLIDGWYRAGASTSIDTTYAPPSYAAGDEADFYRQVIGTACRTCHIALPDTKNWDAVRLTRERAFDHVCGGTPAVAVNASMPNALASRDRLLEKASSDARLAQLMTTYLGCVTPAPDPVYPRR